jgi:MFS family permease
MFFNTWGIINTYGVYQKYYETGLLSYTSSSNISWIGSAQGGLLFLVSVIAGPLCDVGYLRPIVYIGTFLTILGMMMTSLCRTYWQVFIAQGFLVGAGSGLLFLPSIVIVSQYFSTKKSIATGIASMGSSIGRSSDVHHHLCWVNLLRCYQEPWYTQSYLLDWSPL